MEHNRLFINSPTDDELRVLKTFLPSIKKDAQQRAGPEVKAARAVAGGFCGICGENLTAATRSKLLKKLCNVCHGNLLDGQTALVTMDGRYAFVQNDGNEEAKKIAGRIVPIDAKTFDEMAAKNGIEIKQNPNVENN